MVTKILDLVIDTYCIINSILGYVLRPVVLLVLCISLVGCSIISQSEYEALENSNCTWICPKCEMFNFSDSYFDTQCNLESPNRFEPLVKKSNKYLNPPCSNKPTSLNGLKFASININSIRGKNWNW